MRTFGHVRKVRDTQGEVIETKPSPVRAVTLEELGGQFGSDKRKRLVVTLDIGDTITMRPSGTRRAVAGTATDIYRFLIRCANMKFESRVRELKKTNSLRDARKIARKERGW